MRTLPFIYNILLKYKSKAFVYKTCKWSVFLLTMIVYGLFHMCRKTIGTVKPVLHGNCSVDELIDNKHCGWAPFNGKNWSTLLGNLDLTYALVYSFSSYIWGHVAERNNLRYYLSTSLIVLGFVTALFGFGYFLKIHSFFFYLLVQVLVGFVQSSGWPCIIATMGNWFGSSKRGLLMGIWNCQTGLGNILGSVIPGMFINSNWGYSFIVPGLICIFFSVFVFMFLQPYPEDLNQTDPNIADDENDETNMDFSENEDYLENVDLLSHPDKNEPITFFRALCIPNVLPFAFCFFFTKLLNYTFLFWLPTFINQKGGFSPEQSAMLSALVDFGGILGGILIGLVSDVLNARALACLFSMIVLIPYLIVFYIYHAASLVTSICMLTLLGVILVGPYSLISTAVCADLGTHKSLKGNSKAIATVTAIINGTGGFGSAIGPLIAGILIPYGWAPVFLMLIVSVALGIICLIPASYKEFINLLKNRSHLS